MSGQRSGEFRSQPLPELYPSARGACVQEPLPANLPEISMNFPRCCHDRALSH